MPFPKKHYYTYVSSLTLWICVMNTTVDSLIFSEKSCMFIKTIGKKSFTWTTSFNSTNLCNQSVENETYCGL